MLHDVTGNDALLFYLENDYLCSVPVIKLRIMERWLPETYPVWDRGNHGDFRATDRWLHIPTPVFLPFVSLDIIFVPQFPIHKM